jgi:hypothetical protein
MRRERRRKKREIWREFGQFGDEEHSSIVETPSWVLAQNVRNERGMAEAERQLKHQYRVYCSGRSPVEGDPSKSPLPHTGLARYRGLVEKYRKVTKGYCC